MDGVTKELADYFKKLEQLGDMAVGAVKEQIDIETDSAEAEIARGTPEGKTGGLARSLKKTKIESDTRYGYRLEFEGENEQGVPYAKIANILNHGTSTIAPRRFITKAVRKLKGLDDRATQRFNNKTKNID